jgi:hypothetical protein
MLERMMAIEERQVDHTQKLDETEKITKKNNSELVQLRELYGKLIIPIRYNEVQIESDTSIMERYKLKK